MKITYIVNEIQQVGGIERVVCALASWFADKAGYEVELYSICTGEKDKPFFPLSDKVRVINCNYHWQDCIGIKIIPIVRNILKNCNSDIVITSHEYISLSAIWCKPFYKGKIIACEHSEHHYKSPKGELLDLMFLRFADRFVVLRDDEQQFYITKGFKNCITINNSIEKYNGEYADTENKRFIAVGRMTGVKGYDMLIDAFALIHNKIPDWKLRIVGDGEEKDALMKRAVEKGVNEYVEMPGFVKDIYSQLRDASICVLSSRSESFGMCLLEAMSAGLSCCSLNLPAAQAVLGDCGLIAESNNVQALAEVMLKLSESADLRNEYAAKSKQRIKSFYIDEIGPQWLKLFDELIKK